MAYAPLTNTLLLPELREMLAERNEAELREFCGALHPARTAEFMEGLASEETWAVLQFADDDTRVEIFGFFPEEKQVAMLETLDPSEMAGLVADSPPDDRVDLLDEVAPEVVDRIMPLLPVVERRDILRLSAYPEGTAGAAMTTEFARLSESLTVPQAFEELGQQAKELETIYYLFVVDEEEHLRGVVSARQLISAMGHPEVKLSELMERDVVSVDIDDDQEEVAQKVARYDLLAIPVVDDAHHMLGIITYDDVMDVMREEATEDAHRIAAIEPLEESYLKTSILTLTWKRAIWLVVLFFAALLTAKALQGYHGTMTMPAFTWLVWFIPLIISSGGNSGSQSATLVITALTTGDVTLSDWLRVVQRELYMGLLLGGFLGVIGFIAAFVILGNPLHAMVIPITIILVVLFGTLIGGLLPLLFRRLGLDPAMMSSPFVAGIIDIVGIVIYMNVAIAISQIAV
jgi:magnesium transporter